MQKQELPTAAYDYLLELWARSQGREITKVEKGGKDELLRHGMRGTGASV